jgi:HD-like signal output (HDOD) protein
MTGAQKIFPDDVRARQIIRRHVVLPSVPRVVATLISQLKDDSMSSHELVAQLEQDPNLAARTLRVANSSFYSGRRNVASLHDAIVIIGTHTLRTLVISCGIEAAFSHVPNVSLRQFWMDSYLTAQIARGMAKVVGEDCESAFLSGLLHRVGHLILCLAFPEQMAPHLRGVRTLRGEELSEVELQSCGICHTDVGAVWLDDLGLPESTVLSVAHQHSALVSGMALAAVLQLAQKMGASIESGESVQVALEKLDAHLLNLLNVLPDQRHSKFGALYVDVNLHWGQS